MQTLGKIEQIADLRTIWPHEAHDFSAWLSKEENLTLLSDTVGMEIVLEERESSVGDFSVDLFAAEGETDRKIIIENQLEDTNHDHLGKIITYASGKDAEVIIWIVKRARDEHKQAVEWLNQHTDEKIGFFLLEIELWKIGDSLPAPKFNVVERPNDWAKTLKAAEGLSETKKLQLDFWQAFNEYAFADSSFSSKFTKRKARPQHWYSLSVGSSAYHLNLTVNTQKKNIGAEIYIDNSKDIYQKFKDHRSEIEDLLGITLIWKEARQDCRLLALHNGDIKKGREKWEEFFTWFSSMASQLREICHTYVE